jgi:hypothetical protein
MDDGPKNWLTEVKTSALAILSIQKLRSVFNFFRAFLFVANFAFFDVSKASS